VNNNTHRGPTAGAALAAVAFGADRRKPAQGEAVNGLPKKEAEAV
jgi:hypothetical protein